MRKITQRKNLTKQLAQYGALASAIIGVTDASGQSIIYSSDPDPDFTGGLNDSYYLDIDNNGTDDFLIYQEHSFSSWSSSSWNALFIQPLTGSNSVLGSDSSSFAYPFVMSSGSMVSSGAGPWNNQGFSSGYQSLNYNGCSYGNWCDVTDKFLGLRFNSGGNTHYAWLRMDVDNSGTTWTIKDMAYVDTPNIGLEAGQQTLGLESFENLNAVRVVSLDKAIGLYNLNQVSNYVLFDMSGKKVLKGTTPELDSYVIEANSLSSGVYILELSTGNSSIKKKIVL